MGGGIGRCGMVRYTPDQYLIEPEKEGRKKIDFENGEANPLLL